MEEGNLIDKLTAVTILDERIFLNLLEIEDEVDQQRELLALQSRAAELGKKTEFLKLWKAYQKQKRTMEREQNTFSDSLNNPIPLRYTEKGTPALTIENFMAILQGDGRLKDLFLFNELSNTPERIENGVTRRWTDEDDSWLRGYIEQKYHLYSPQKLDDALRVRFAQKRYHPVRDKIKSLVWDGKPRIKRLLIDWMKADDCAYSEEVSRLIFAGGIHRIFNPGCKFEDMAVLIGKKQGEGKSTFVRWLAMEDRFFREVNEIDGQRGIEAVEGAWICEVSELLALKRTKEVEAAKSYFSRQVDTYRKPFDRRITENLRQCIFIGTTNTAEFLTDKTGNRRYYPVICNNSGRNLFDHKEELKAYIEQCWAEAYALFLQDKLSPVLDKSLIEEVQYHQESALEDDYRVGMVTQYLNEKQDGETVCIIELWERALHESFKPNRKDSNELSLIMQNAPGWIKLSSPRKTATWGNQRCWVKISGQKRLREDLPF